jgi:hypothetical protein
VHRLFYLCHRSLFKNSYQCVFHRWVTEILHISWKYLPLGWKLLSFLITINQGSSFFFFFLIGLGFELRALHLQSRHSTTWTISPVHFALIIFGDGVLQTICPDWPQTTILPISTSQRARIIGVSPWCWTMKFSS